MLIPIPVKEKKEKRKGREKTEEEGALLLRMYWKKRRRSRIVLSTLGFEKDGGQGGKKISLVRGIWKKRK